MRTSRLQPLRLVARRGQKAWFGVSAALIEHRRFAKALEMALCATFGPGSSFSKFVKSQAEPPK